MTIIIENAFIARLAGGFPRSPLQLNALRESDAELIRLPGTDMLLAVTTDAIVEEIEVGLYNDPYLIGWMTVMANASDLAAVGAEPLGILLNQTLPPDLDEDFISRLQQGIEDACASCDLYVLGGDTNFSSRMKMAASALGLIRGGAPLTRRGCKPGDRLFVSGPLGLGAAFAFLQLNGDSPGDQPSLRYQPEARIRVGQLLRRFASCCMDTSDGALTTLDELMRLNRVGFLIERRVEELLHPDATLVSEAAGLPSWTMLAAPHGEFELIFTIAEDRCGELLECAASHGWRPIEIGSVVPEPCVQISVDGKRSPLDTGRIRNLSSQLGSNVKAYVAELSRLDSALRAS